MGIYNTFDWGDGTLYGDSAKVGYSASPFTATAIGTTVYEQPVVIRRESNGTPVYGTTQVVRPKVFLTWTKPTGSIFGFRVVRNQDGWSESSEDGEIILETFEPVIPEEEYVYDELSNTPLVEGRYAYYTVWVLLADYSWAVAAYTYCLIPTRHNVYSPDGTVYKSSERRFLELFPKVYTTEQQSYVDEVSETSDFRTFLGGFSYTLDEMLTFADLLIPDISGRTTNPNTVGIQAAQMGLPKEPTLSLQRKKALIRNALTINKQRGTGVGIESLAESLTGFAPEVTLSPNLLLSIQDSSFYKTVGNWKIAANGTLTANLTTGSSDLPLQTNTYSVDRSWTGKAVTTGSNVIMSLGKDDPRLKGIPVVEGTEYVWSFYTKVTGTGYATTPTITWYDSKGNSLSTSAGTNFTPTTSWVKTSVTATAPTNAYFAAIQFSFSSASTYYIDMVQFAKVQTGITLAYYEARGITLYLAPTKVNYLPNPSFGASAAGYTWAGQTAYDTTTDSTVPGISLDNSKMFQLTTTADTAYSISTETPATLPLGRYYTFSVYVSTTSGTEYGQLNLQAFTDGDAIEEETLGLIKASTPVKTITSSWARQSVSLFVPDGYVNVSLVASVTSPVATIPTQTPVIAAGKVTLTTSAPHGFTAGQKVKIAGLSPNGYNNTSATIFSVDSPTTFTYTNATTGAITVGGTATQVANGNEINFDAAQVEEGYGVTDYFDGSYAARGAYWLGTADDSTSVLYENKVPKINRLIQEIPDYLPLNTAFVVTSGYDTVQVLEYSGVSS